MTKASQVPVIDISGLRAADPAARRAVAAELGAACRGPGFFLVTGHGIAPATTENLFAAARDLFALPEAAKQAHSIRHSPHNRGYVGLSEEQLDPGKPADRKEAFNVGLDLAADDPEVLAGMPFRGANLWPEGAPELRAAIMGISMPPGRSAGCCIAASRLISESRKISSRTSWTAR